MYSIHASMHCAVTEACRLLQEPVVSKHSLQLLEKALLPALLHLTCTLITDANSLVSSSCHRSPRMRQCGAQLRPAHKRLAIPHHKGKHHRCCKDGQHNLLKQGQQHSAHSIARHIALQHTSGQVTWSNSESMRCMQQSSSRLGLYLEHVMMFDTGR